MKDIEIVLIRKIYSDKSTIGELFINNELFCNTLEDVVRETKVYGETAIPAGTYQVIINLSKRFKCNMPLLINVPGFEGIRIHPGNHKDNTEGCILLGKYNKNKPNWISNSKDTYYKFLFKLQDLLNKNKVYIKILDSKDEPWLIS